MAGATSKSAWSGFERVFAADLSEALGVVTTRNPLSGANSRDDNGRPRPGDVIVPPGYSFLAELKYRAKHAHHTLYEDATKDAAKHGIDPKRAILGTKVKGQRGYCITVGSELFFAMLGVPGVQDLLRAQPKGNVQSS